MKIKTTEIIQPGYAMRTWVFAVALFALIILIYYPTLQAGFILDGHYVIEANPNIKSVSRLPDVFLEDMFSAYKYQQVKHLTYYRPMVKISFMLDYFFWNVQASGYRITNILLHYANSLLVYLLIAHLFRDRRLGILTAFLFAILPVHEWVVGYAVGRGDLLQTLFSLLTIYTLVKGLEMRKLRLYTISVGFYICGLLSREVTVLLPVLLMSFIAFYEKSLRRGIMLSIPYWFMGGLYILTRSLVFPIFDKSYTDFFTFRSIFDAAQLSFDYCYRFFIPWNLLSELPVAFQTPNIV
ncbi:MAG: glycosyltransferase family 39 protein, partial [Candidatus Omnitrophica bacterium]|nr:glycosyltransferase family 39 protein [Candidatus Omnitrophota bacterium]